MISSIINEYSFGNILLLCFQIILPLLIYIISFVYVSDKQSDWFNNLQLSSGPNLLTGNKAMFVGCAVYILTGISSLLILDYYYQRNVTGVDKVGNKIIANYFKGDKDSDMHFFLFPIMIFISNIGFIIAYQTKDLLAHIILNSIGIVINLYLMFHYMKNISYKISILLIPLLLWQLFNFIYFIFGIYGPKRDSSSKESKSDSNSNSDTDPNSNSNSNPNPNSNSDSKPNSNSDSNNGAKPESNSNNNNSSSTDSTNNNSSNTSGSPNSATSS